MRPTSLAAHALAVAASAAGMALHTAREFGGAALLAPSSGMIPVTLVQLLLLTAWWRAPAHRHGLTLALAATGWFQLVGGAILSVLPLPFLPFEPEQSMAHYLSHLVLGLAQIPLVALPLLAGRRVGA